MNTISFMVQVQNETDGDRCRYALVTVLESVLRQRQEVVQSLNGIDHHFEGALFSGGFVGVHFLDASFPADPQDEVPEGQDPFLSGDEFAAFDAEGWCAVPDALVARARADMSGFVDEVEDVRLLVTPLGIQVCASWDGDAFVRSWTVPWDVLPERAPA